MAVKTPLNVRRQARARRRDLILTLREARAAVRQVRTNVAAFLNPIIILALLAGAMTALQPPTNAMLARSFASPIAAALISFLVGSAVLAILVLFAPGRFDAGAVRDLPWYAWLGGAYGAFFVAVAAFGAPIIGVGALITTMIAGQVLMAVLLDHFGALGLARTEISATRVAGLLLVVAGVVLVRRT